MPRRENAFLLMYTVAVDACIQLGAPFYAHICRLSQIERSCPHAQHKREISFFAKIIFPISLTPFHLSISLTAAFDTQKNSNNKRETFMLVSH